MLTQSSDLYMASLNGDALLTNDISLKNLFKLWKLWLKKYLKMIFVNY